MTHIEKYAEIISTSYESKTAQAIPWGILLKIIIVILQTLFQYSLEHNLSIEQFVKKYKSPNLITRTIMRNRLRSIIAGVNNGVREEDLTEILMDGIDNVEEKDAVAMIKEANFQLI